MVYEVPASKASIKQNRFEFKVGQKTYSLPKMQYLSLNQMALMQTIDESASVETIVHAFVSVDSAAGKAIGALDQEQVKGLFAAWQAESNISVGESLAS